AGAPPPRPPPWAPRACPASSRRRRPGTAPATSGFHRRIGRTRILHVSLPCAQRNTAGRLAGNATCVEELSGLPAMPRDGPAARPHGCDLAQIAAGTFVYTRAAFSHTRANL